MSLSLKFLSTTATVLSLATVPLSAQCQLEWQPGRHVPGVNGTAHTMVPAPGAGAVYAVGKFQVVGGTFAENAALWDGNAWSSLGAGVNGDIHDAVKLPNGDLVVGGSFTSAGGAAASHVARWDGTSWSPIGIGLSAPVRKLLTMPSGDVLAVGGFVFNGQVSAIARWDGTSWTPYATFPVGNNVQAMAIMPNGDLVIAGSLFMAGVPTFGAIAIWDGVSWSGPASATGWHVTGLQLMPNGDLAICGNIPGGERFALWDGTNFQFEPVPQDVLMRDLALDANGDLYGVTSRLGPNEGPAVLRRSNGAWNVEFSHPRGFQSLAISNGQLFAGGDGGEEYGSSVVEFDGTSWNPLGGDGTPAPDVLCIAGGANNTVYAGGTFNSIGGVSANSVAYFDGTTWHAMGLGVGGGVGAVTNIEVAPNGDVVVTGSFTTAGGVPVLGIALWNGISWSTVGGTGLTDPSDLAIGPNGEIAIVKYSAIELFDGSAWTSIAAPSGISSLIAVDFLANGDLVVGGALAGANVQVWDGVTWTELGAVVPYDVTFEVAVAPNGDIYRAGVRFNIATVAMWDGTTWQQLGGSFPGSITTISFLPTGEAVVFGGAPNGNDSQVFKWDDGRWQTIGSALNGLYPSGSAFDLTVNDAGELWISGPFVAVDSQVSTSYARAVSSCPATATVFGAGCVGSNGPMTLESLSDPWLGTTLRSRATGFPQVSIALHVLGLNSVVLPLPGGAPGCFQLVDPVLFELHAPLMGAVETSFDVPNIAALTGHTFRSQVIGLELSPALSLTGMTSTNALALTIGSY